MSANVNKNIERLVDKAMKNAALEKPSFNFTAQVMSQVLATSKSNVTVYKPLISKTVWLVIFAGVLALMVYISLSGNNETSNWFDAIDFSVLYRNSILNMLFGFKFSKIAIYGIVLFSVMLFIQIPILKNYFDKRLEI